MPMNITAKLVLAAVGGLALGATAMELAHAAAKPPAFDSSPEYTALKVIRDQSTRWRSFVVKGLPG